MRIRVSFEEEGRGKALDVKNQEDLSEDLFSPFLGSAHFS